VSEIYLIADLHLSAQRPAVLGAFGHWLDGLAGCDTLYILGDLFDTWIGDDDDAPVAVATRALLGRYTRTGGRLYLMHGNRDFLLGSAFCHETGATLLPDPSVVDLHGQRTLLMHGDTLCTGDTDYLAFRARARTEAWRDEVLARPLTARRAMAGDLRRLSRVALDGKAPEVVAVSEEALEAAVNRAGVHRLIHGHTHRPGRHLHPWGERWVLGDWARLGWFLRATPTGLSLHQFMIDEQPVVGSQ